LNKAPRERAVTAFARSSNGGPIQTGIGPVEVERVKIRDRAAAEDGERIRFT